MNTPRTFTLLLFLLCVCAARGQTPAASPEAASPAPSAIVAPASSEEPAPAPRAQKLADELVSKIHAAGKIGYLQVMLSIIAMGIALASISTLLGLLGTVIGTIASFEAVALAGSMGDPSIMASQISYALVTTAIGLSVAVPCIVAYQLLRRKAAALATELDEQVSTLISTWQIALRHKAEAPSAPGA